MSQADELQEYLMLANDDLSEVGESLIFLGTRDYLLSDNFKNALKIEIGNQLNFYKENCVIQEEEETVTNKYKTLVWDES